MSWLAPNLPADKHCFFGAEGGFSTGIYQSMNVSINSCDSPENVQKNLIKAAARFNLEPQNLHMLKQGVSAHVEYTAQAQPWQITADGAVTDQPDIILCIRTADCAPVLLADYYHGIIGAAHAGWRGAFGGVIEHTIDLMIAKGARLENIAAAVGPCIAQKSYEVDDQFYHTINQPQYFSSGRSGHWHFNLEAYCVDKLKHCGVTDICASGIDTYDQTNGYFSFRRNTHLGLIKQPKDFPVELSAIVL